MDDTDSLFTQCEARIQQLEAALAVEKDRKANLEKLRVEKRAKNAPINRLPQELLLQVLKELKCDNSLAIHPILLVSRHWSNVAYNTPSLWKAISINIRPDLAAIGRQVLYINAAIDRSRNLPLDIDLTFPDELELWSGVAQNMLRPMQPDINVWTDRDQVAMSLHCSHRAGGNLPVAFYKVIDRAIFDLVRFLVGENGQRMERFRSLKLKFRGQDLWNWCESSVFSHPCPLLEDLTILRIGVDSYRRFLSPHAGRIDLAKSFSHPCPNLSRIICDSDLDFSQLLIRKGQLTHLRAVCPRKTGIPQRLGDPGFTCNLRLLHIFIPLDWPKNPPLTISLPIVEDLTIESSETFNFSMFHCPNLKTLRSLDEWSTLAFIVDKPQFPLLEKLHVWLPPNIDTSAQTFIGIIPSIKELGLLYLDGPKISTGITLYKGVKIKLYEFRRADFVRSFGDYEYNEIRTSQEIPDQRRKYRYRGTFSL